MKKYEIRYYLSEGAYKLGIPAYTETITTSRAVALSIAQSRMKSNSNFKYYEIVDL